LFGLNTFGEGVSVDATVVFVAVSFGFNTVGGLNVFGPVVVGPSAFGAALNGPVVVGPSAFGAALKVSRPDLNLTSPDFSRSDLNLTSPAAI
jgi:hypothetical protein